MADGTVTLPVLSRDRAKVGEISLPARIVAGPQRPHLLHAAVLSQLAGRRAGTASTKTRAFVSGGGKKPWKQKGTGRARAGSSRSPLWPGGAVIFGPQPRDYDYRLPRSARRVALEAALSTRHGEGKLLVVDALALPEPKTKAMVAWLKGFGLDGTVLIVLGAKDDAVQRAGRNLPGLKVLLADGVNVYDVLRHECLVVTRDALQQIVTRLGGEG
ncbi:MAG: 50S ribosomal protein L4 [Candidatus Binatia bacterium]